MKNSKISSMELSKHVRGALEGGRRVRRYQFNGESIALLFTHGQKFLVKNGIPLGAAFKGFTIDHNTNCVAIWLEHESFSVVPTGGQAPDGPPVEFERLR